jgi:hypothetical protein
MAGSIVDSNASAKTDQWRERIAEQQRSGLSVKQFCKERELSLWSFYQWRKRLRETGPVRFALVDGGSPPQDLSSNGDLEVVFASGERLRVRPGVDGATLRTVVEAFGGCRTPVVHPTIAALYSEASAISPMSLSIALYRTFPHSTSTYPRDFWPVNSTVAPIGRITT